MPAVITGVSPAGGPIYTTIEAGPPAAPPRYVPTSGRPVPFDQGLSPAATIAVGAVAAFVAPTIVRWLGYGLMGYGAYKLLKRS